MDASDPPPISTPPQSDIDSEPLWTQILTPGSSLHPTFLLILDGAFVFLLLVLLGLLWMTRSVHFVVLVLVEMGLWGSIKWTVNELHKISPPKPQLQTQEEREKKDT